MVVAVGVAGLCPSQENAPIRIVINMAQGKEIKMKKFAYFAILSVVCCACSPQLRQVAPNHVGITPSCEWEIQKGHEVKHKPKIQTSLDWNF